MRFQSKNKSKQIQKGLHSTEVALLLLTQQPRVQFSTFMKVYFHVAKIYRQRRLEEIGQRLGNVLHRLVPS